MISLDEMFKKLDDQLENLPIEVRSTLNKYKNDLKKVALDQEKTIEQKQNEMEFINKSFNIEVKNEFKTDK